MKETSYGHFGYAIYVLQDVKSETLRYIGCTNNLARRMKQHRPKDDPKTPLEKWRE